MSILDAIRKTREDFLCECMEAPDITLQRHEQGIALLGECQSKNMLGPWNIPTRAYVGLPFPSRPIYDPDKGNEPIEVEYRRLALPHCGKLVWIVDTGNPEPKPYMEISIYGMKVRWPAKRMAVQGDESIWY